MGPCLRATDGEKKIKTSGLWGIIRGARVKEMRESIGGQREGQTKIRQPKVGETHWETGKGGK